MLRALLSWGRRWKDRRPSQDKRETNLKQLPEGAEWIPDDRGPVCPPAPLSDFVSWWCEYGTPDGRTKHELWLEYGEFCLVSHTEQLSQGQFFRRVRMVGIERYRETTGERRWLYRVRKAVIVRLVGSGGPT